MWYVLVLADQQDLPAVCAQNPAGCVGARLWVRSLSLVPVLAYVNHSNTAGSCITISPQPTFKYIQQS